MKPRPILPFCGFIAVLLTAALPVERAAGDERSSLKAPTARSSHKRIAVIHPAGRGHVQGTVLFEKIAGRIRVTARVGGLKANSVHSIRIEGLRDDGSGRGRIRRGDQLQAGDLGNLISDGNGNASHLLDLESGGFGEKEIAGLRVIIRENAGSGDWPDKEAGDAIGSGLIRPAP